MSSDHGNSVEPFNVDQLFLRFQKTGEAEALGKVFDQTAPELLSVASHLTSDLSLAEDLVQATFLAAIQHRHSYQPKGTVISWLVGILTKLAAVQRRSGKHRRTDDIDDLCDLVD